MNNRVGTYLEEYNDKWYPCGENSDPGENRCGVCENCRCSHAFGDGYNRGLKEEHNRGPSPATKKEIKELEKAFDEALIPKGGKYQVLTGYGSTRRR